MLAEALYGARARWTQTDEGLYEVACYLHALLELQEVSYYHWQLSVTEPGKRGQVPKPTPRPAPRRPWEAEAAVEAEVEDRPPLSTRDQVRTFFGGGVAVTGNGGPAAEDQDLVLGVPGDGQRPPVDLVDDPAARAAAWAEAQARRQGFGLS